MPRGIRIGGSANGSQILANLNKEVRRIKGATKGGLKLAANLIMTESISRTPVDTGSLKGGHYVAQSDDPKKIVAEVGVMADYAIYVHEILTNVHPTGEAKFLENAIDAKKDDVIKIIQRTAKIK